MKRPWYIWTSLFGFIFLWIKLCFRALQGLFRREKGLMDWWVPGCFLVFGLLAGCLGVPVILLDVLAGLRSENVAIIRCLSLIWTYFSGVFITAVLDNWERKHLT